MTAACSIGDSVVATQLAPRSSNASQESYTFASNGTVVSSATVPQLPNGKDSVSLLDFKFDLDTFPALYDAIDALPFFSKSTYNNGVRDVPQVRFESPSVAGFQATADLRFDLAASIKLAYDLDFGQFTFDAAAVSALRLEDRDPLNAAQPPNDPDADLYTNLTIDTGLAGITVSAQSGAAVKESKASLDFKIDSEIGAFNAGFLGNLLGLSVHEEFSVGLFQGRPGDNVAGFTSELLSGYVNVPSLPSTLNVQAGGTGAALFAPTSDSDDGPVFANITFDPLPLIPVVGQFNEGSFYPIQTFLLDVGVEWKILTLDFGANLRLNQKIEVSIKSVDVAIEVDEKYFDINDHKLVRDVNEIGRAHV